MPPESIERACDIFRHGEPERHQFWDDETHNEPASSGPRKKAEPVQISELDALIKKMRDNLAGIPEGDFEIDGDEVAIDDLDFGKSALSKLKGQAGKRRKAARGGRLTNHWKSKKKGHGSVAAAAAAAAGPEAETLSCLSCTQTFEAS